MQEELTFCTIPAWMIGHRRQMEADRLLDNEMRIINCPYYEARDYYLEDVIKSGRLARWPPPGSYVCKKEIKE